MAEVINVTLNKTDSSSGLGFSLLGTPGFPPVIYDIIENSPAAESGQVEAGDIIVKINETDVIRCNTKEVLKCIRLSQNPVSLELKRDPVIKDKVRHLLFSPACYPDENGDVICAPPGPPSSVATGGVGGGLMSSEDYETDSPAPPPSQHPPPLNTVTRSNGTGSGGVAQVPPPRCEAFVMTGERVLNLTRTPQVSILPKQKKKIDSLCMNKNSFQHCHHGPRHSSVPTSPNESHHHHHHADKHQHSASCSPSPSLNQSSRSFKSEDTLSKNDSSGSHSNGRDIMDDDVMASMNTLLDTRPDTDSRSNPTSSSLNNSFSSPTSPTSVSSSVMSSSAASAASTERKRAFDDSPPQQPPSQTQQSSVQHHPGLVQQESLSQSEGISNISSPDFGEGDDTGGILSPRDLLMQVSDPSDSDSTLLVCEPKVRRTSSHQPPPSPGAPPDPHRLVIQVKGGGGGSVETNNNNLDRKSSDPHRTVDNSCDNNVQNSLANNTTSCGVVDETEDPHLLALAEGAAQLARSISLDTTASDDSDVDSLQSFHFSPKAVDYPSALRLAKRLYHLEGFKKSDVSRHLSKNNDFSRVVAEEYLKYFNFEEDSLDMALRKFLKQFVLIGETQERERVLIHFSKRYLDCNPGSFKSQDAVHTLTCAIMLLNTDLHAQVIGRKMTCTEFIENLADLNDGENFPREILKQLYHAIKSNPLEWAVDDDEPLLQGKGSLELPGGPFTLGGKEETPLTAVEYKKGYVKRKCCIDPNGKRTPLGKRGWKMYYCSLRDLVLYLHKDEAEVRGGSAVLPDGCHSLRVHHALATKATEYRKKQHVFKLETSDRAEYLFQTSDSKELQSWIDMINLVAALLSAQPLPGGIGSQKKFQRPLLPSSHTRLSPREQMKSHEDMVQHLEQELDQHKLHPPDKHAKGLTVQNYKDKNSYLQSEIKRYKIYSYILSGKLTGASQPPPLLPGQVTGGGQLFDSFSLLFPPAHLTLHEGGEMTEEGEGEENASPNHHHNNNNNNSSSRQNRSNSHKKNLSCIQTNSKSPVLSKKVKNKT